MILTKDDRMVRTPTYHLFGMYKAYRDAQSTVHVGLTNADPGLTVVVTPMLDGMQAVRVSGRVLTGPAVNSIDTFEQPNVVVPAAFSGASLSGKTLTVAMPPHAVEMLDAR